MKLHGHTRLELTNIHTGQTEIVEKDNLITDAVAGVFNGLGGSMNWQRLIAAGDERWTAAPKDLLTMFYGGLLLYNTRLGTDASVCFAPAAAGITGTAVYGKVNDGANTVRGNCNLTETSIDPENGVATYVYEFGTGQANGVIASVCLTSPLGGYFSETAGTAPAVSTQAARMDFGGTLGGYDKLLPGLDTAYLYPADALGTVLYADPTADTVTVGRLTTGSTAALTLQRHALNLHSIDLFRRGTDGAYNSKMDESVLSLSGFLQATGNACNRLCCDAERRKFYLVSAPSGSSCSTSGQFKVREYDLDTLESTDYALPNNTGVKLKNAVAAAWETPLNGTVYDGWVYFVAYDGSAIYRVKLTDASAVQQVTLNGRMMTTVSDWHDGRLYFYDKSGSVVLNTAENALLGIEAAGTETGTSHAVTVPVLGEPVAPLLRYIESSRVYTTRTLRGNYLATVNDLDASVEKTADKTMKITYTLRKGA